MKKPASLCLTSPLAHELEVIKLSTALDHSFLTFGLTLPRLSSLTSFRNGSHTFLIGGTLSFLSVNHVLIISFPLVLNLLALPVFFPI